LTMHGACRKEDENLPDGCMSITVKFIKSPKEQPSARFVGKSVLARACMYTREKFVCTHARKK